MENKNIILIAIVVLIIAVGCVAGFVFTKNNDTSTTLNNTNNNTHTNSTNSSTVANNTENVTATVDNSTDNVSSNDSNATYKVYNPQSDSYVPVIGEEYDEEVDRWYTYDSDGVRYYNTRIN